MKVKDGAKRRNKQVMLVSLLLTYEYVTMSRKHRNKHKYIFVQKNKPFFAYWHVTHASGKKNNFR